MIKEMLSKDILITLCFQLKKKSAADIVTITIFSRTLLKDSNITSIQEIIQQ